MLHSANWGLAAAKRLPLMGSSHAFASSAAAAMSVSEDLKKLLKDPSLLKTESYIGGSWVGAADGDTVEVRVPGPCMGPSQARTRRGLQRACLNAYKTWTRCIVGHARRAWPASQLDDRLTRPHPRCKTLPRER